MMAGEERRKKPYVPPGTDLPRSIELEQQVLGTLLVDNEGWLKVSDMLSPASFSEPIHRKTFEAIVALVEQGRVANPLTLRAYLRDEAVIEGMNVSAYLKLLAEAAAEPLLLREYAQNLNELKIRRDLIEVAQSMLDKAMNMHATETCKSVVDLAMERLGILRTSPGETTEFLNFEEASLSAMRRVQETYTSFSEDVVGLSTGLPSLDNAMGGLQAPDLVILGGRPGMGKTSLATNIAFNVSSYLGDKRAAGHKRGVVLFYSLEMSADQLVTRIICERAEIPQWKLRRKLLQTPEIERLEETRREYVKLPIRIDASPEMSVAKLAMRSRQMHKREGVELIVVDYLQLLKGSSKWRDNRSQEVTEITTGLKNLAKELNVPILALSQLSREVERRDTRRPQLSDLRESGSIEQDGDIVMFVHREEYYIQKEKVPQPGTEARLNYDRRMIEAKGIADIIIAKNRHGPEATIQLGFNSQLTVFHDRPEEREPMPLAPEQRRNKKQEIKGETLIVMSCVRSGCIGSHSVNPSEVLLARHEGRLKENSRLVPVEVVEEIYARETGQPVEQAKGPFRTHMKKLRAAEIAYWIESEEKGRYLIWMPNLVGKVDD